MKTLKVFVITSPKICSGNVVIEQDEIKVNVPEFYHENLIRILKKLGGWKVELIHSHAGFGKPYLLSLSNEKNEKIKISIVPQRDFIKTNLIDCTFKSLEQFTLTGPNITTNKSQIDKTRNGMKLELVSHGALIISSHPLQIKDVSARVISKEGCTDFSDIYVDTGAVLKCNNFETNQKNNGGVFINGTVTCGILDEDRNLNVRIGSGDLHVSINGVLGQDIKVRTTKDYKNLTRKLNVVIVNGNLTNFGTLYAQDHLSLKCNNILLCSDSKHDTAQRGFYSFISLQKELGHVSDISIRPKKSSSFCDTRLLHAVQSLDSDDFISALNEGIDPAVEVSGRSIQTEVNAIYGARTHQSAYDRKKDRKEVIRGGMATCNWRHGVIRSASIYCIIMENVYDCSQFQGDSLRFDVGGSVSVIEPWTWKCGQVGGHVRGDVLFFDNVILRQFDQLHVHRNVRIFKKSTVWIKEGGALYIGKVFENNNAVKSDENFILDTGTLLQHKEGFIISNGNLSLALREDVEDSWFGYVYADHHILIRLAKNVSCNAECTANESCRVEFFGVNAQLVINHVFNVKEGDLNLEATDKSETPNFVLYGELHAKGIDGVTASVCTMPGATVHLTCARDDEQPQQRTVNVITRCLKISSNSLVVSKSITDDLNFSTNVFSQESMSVHGTLQAFGTSLNIQAKAFDNSGKVELLPVIPKDISITSSLNINCQESAINTGTIECDGTLVITSEYLSNDKGVIKSLVLKKIGKMELSTDFQNESSTSSSLCIKCKESVSNTGTIECDGTLAIESEKLSNEKGVIKSIVASVLDLGKLRQDSEGTIISSGDILLVLREEIEEGWFGYVSADRRIFMEIQKKVSCDAKCITKESCHVEFFGKNAQLVVHQVLNVKEGKLNLKAIDKCQIPNFVLFGELRAKGIDGVTASVCTMPGATVHLTCTRDDDEQPQQRTVNVITRRLKISSNSLVVSKSITDDLNFSTNVFSQESMSVHGTLQAFGTSLNIQAKTFDNSGKVKLLPDIVNENSAQSCLYIICQESALNTGTIECNGTLVITSECLSNEKGVIKSLVLKKIGKMELSTDIQKESSTSSSLCIKCKENISNTGTIECDGTLAIESETLSNEKGVIKSIVTTVLELGKLRQDSEGTIISNGDILLVLREEVEEGWFGYVYADHHILIRLAKNVSCNAECTANESCRVEFFGVNAQLVINHVFNVKEGDLNLEATDKSETPNFVLYGELHAKGIDGVTASVCTMPGATVHLTCARDDEQPQQRTVNVITRCLKISSNSLVVSKSITDDLNFSTNVFSQESMSVHGTLQAFGTSLNIQAKAFDNSGKVELLPVIPKDISITSSLNINCQESAINTGTIECDGTLVITSEYLSNDKGVIKSLVLKKIGKMELSTDFQNESSTSSSLCIKCKESVSNTGTIECDGTLAIESEKLSNEKGVIKSIVASVLDLGKLRQDSEGTIISSGDILLVLREEIEEGWFGYVSADRHILIRLAVFVSCNAKCMAKESCHVEFIGKNAQLVVHQVLNVKEGELELVAKNVCDETNFLLFGELRAKGINGITARVCTMPGATVHLTCARDDEQPQQRTVNVITRCLKISSNSIMVSKSINDDLNLSTNVFSQESMSVHGTLQAFGTSLNIQAKTFNNSGKVELSTYIQNESSTSSSLRIICKENVSNTGRIECGGNLTISSERLSNVDGVIKSWHDLCIYLHSNDAATLSGRFFVDKYFCVDTQSERQLSFSAVGGKGESTKEFILPDQLEVRCKKGHLSINSSIFKCKETFEPECLFLLRKHLEFHKVCQFGKVYVEFHEGEDNNSIEMGLKLQVNGSVQANFLGIRVANPDAPTKPRISFEGSNMVTIIHTLDIDKSIYEATFDTDMECMNIQAISIDVPGRLRCIQPTTNEKQPSTITVEETITLSGIFESEGIVDVYAGNSFVQAKVGCIDVQKTLKITTSQNGLVSMGGSTKGKRDSSTSLEVEAKNVKIMGSMINVSDLKLIAEKDLYLTEEGRIFSCKRVEIKGEWITVAGSIEEFTKLHIQPWAILNSGKIESALLESDVSLCSDLALVNSGICRGQVTSLEAPFLLSLPGKEIGDVKDITHCELFGREKVILESITCFLGGSTLKSNRLIENNTVLLFKFLTYVSSTPDAKSLEAWSQASESLKIIQSEYEASKQNHSFKQVKSFKESCVARAEIELRIAQMYSMVNNFVEDVLLNGIESFDVRRLVFIITSESKRYSQINLWKERLLAIPKRAREIRRLVKDRVKSMRERFGFSESTKKSNKTEGILESGIISFGEGVTSTDSVYEAYFDELFYDEGFVSAGSVAVGSEEIVMSKREKKAITMVLYAENVCSAGDVTSNSLVIKSSKGKAQLVGKIKSDKVKIEANAGIDLAYNDKSTGKKNANHQFRSLSLKTNKINQLNNFLKSEGIYQNLKIADQLDLAVTDEDVVLSNCNINCLYELRLHAKSVNIDNSRLSYKKGASITSDQSLNVSHSSITSEKSTILRSAKGNVSMDSSNVEASDVAAVISSEGSISMTAGLVSGDKGALLKAKEDVIVDPIEKHHTSSSSKSRFFSSSKDSSSYSEVSQARISSGCGNVSIVSEEGKVEATATEITAAENIAVEAKKNVVIKDKVTVREEEHVKENWFNTSKTIQRTEEQHCSTLKAGGSLSILSQDSNVSIIGTDCLANKDMKVDAAETVSFKDRILSKSEERRSSGLSLSFDKGISIGSKTELLNQQRLSGRSTTVGGNSIVKAKNFDVKNAMAVGNMIIDAETINFEGAETKNTTSKKEWSLDVGAGTVDISWGQSSSKEKKVINQDITVRGRTHFTRAKDVNLTACNFNTGAISGNVENFNITTNQSEIEAFNSKKGIGFAVIEGYPIPKKFGMSQSVDVGKFVEKSSGIHCRGSINGDEFKVGSLTLKGSSVTADGAIGNFARKMISEKVYSTRSQISVGFFIGVDKTGLELGLRASNKSMSMEHDATIASSSEVVSENIRKSVNTDFSKHAQITKQKSSAFGLNLKATARQGFATGLQINDVSAGCSVSRQNVGGHLQYADKGISMYGSTSGFSASLQDGENSLGVGLSKENISFNATIKDTGIGSSLGKSGFSASAQHKSLGMDASSFKGSKSIKMKAGDFKTAIKHEKDAHTGKKTTSGSLKAGDLKVAGSTSKDSKSLDFKAGDFKTVIKHEEDALTGKKTTSGSLKAGDLKVAGSTSENSKSLDVKVGDLKTAIKHEEDALTGKKTTSGSLKAGDLKVAGSTSEDSKSLNFEAGDFKTVIKHEKDALTGKKTTSGSLKTRDLKVAGSTSKDSKSLDFKAGDFKTVIKHEEDALTGKKTTSGSLKAGDLKVAGSTSEGSKSLDFEAGGFKTVIKHEEDALTGKKTTSGSLKAGDLKVAGSTSEDSKSLDFEAGDFKTVIKHEEDALTGKKTTSGSLKAGDLKVAGSTSEGSKSLDFEAGDFKTVIKHEEDALTGKKTTSGSLKAGDLKVAGSTSEGSKSLDFEAGDFKTVIKHEEDALTGKKTTSGSLKAGDLKVAGSTSEGSKSLDFEAGDFKTVIKHEEDALTGKKTTSGSLKAGDLKVAGSTSEGSKSLDFEAGDFKTVIKHEEDALTGKKTTSGSLKAGDLKVAGSTSEGSKSLNFEAGDFKTVIKHEKDALTGKKTTSGSLKTRDLKVAGSTSKDSKSLDFKAGDFKTVIKHEEDALTGKKTTSGSLKAGDLKVAGSTSEGSKSLDFEAGGFKTVIKHEEDALTEKKTTSGSLKAGDLKVAGSTSEDSKSLDFEAGDFKTVIKHEEDALTGKKTTSGSLKAGDLKVAGSTSEGSKSLDFEAGDFKTVIKHEEDALTGKKTTSGSLKAGDLKVAGSTSEGSKSLDFEAGDFKTVIKHEKDSCSGKRLRLEGSASKYKNDWV